MSLKVGVMASGRGSNFQAILTEIESGSLDAQIGLLVSDRSEAPALRIAEEHGIEALSLPYDKQDRGAFESLAGDAFEAAGCDYILLAGFMRILTPAFIDRFENRILNIHPSLLPSFKGLHPQRQAIDAGVKFSGCTVHLVTQELDSGPILSQAVVPVFERDTEETLSQRILEQEHRVYAEAIQVLSQKTSACKI